MKNLVLSAMLLLPAIGWSETLEKQRMQQFMSSQQALQAATQQFCSEQAISTDNLLDLWQQAVVSWYQVSALQLPAAEFMQTQYSFVFWPDSKDRLKSQVLSALNSQPDETDTRALSSSVTSLSAMEFILTEQPEQASSHCDWLTYITDYQVEQSSQLVNLQALYDFEDLEWLNALHGTALVAADHLKEISARGDRLIWQLGPAWRSGTTWEIQYALNDQLDQLISHFLPDDEALNEWQTQLQAFELSHEPPELNEVLAYKDFLFALAEYIEHDLATKLDIFLGFNNFDGD
ncbi:hypothetical protein [Reinekea marinisedimentorum]|uniref:Putative lipoprotein n=1 Tax=Reinekea marinisedimentorum TaxID=230495 RepID=A0A4R3I9M0_9GAMM|nr:hypothetical protein [Reinekea marinisedimentorum]TCS43099.1 putative lipoprotein [Reinekea marinisedimentorum]